MQTKENGVRIYLILTLLAICYGEDLPLHIDLGVYVKEVPNVILYGGSIPLIYRLPYIPYTTPRKIQSDRLCDWHSDHMKNSNNKHIVPSYNQHRNETFSKGIRLCRMSKETYHMVAECRSLLKSLEMMDSPGEEPEHVKYGTRPPRAALAEPVGVLLEMITGNPSAVTFRGLQGHVSYIDRFLKKLTTETGKMETGYIKLTEGMSKLSMETKNGFDVVEQRLDLIEKYYNILQKSYDMSNVAQLNQEAVTADLMTTQYGILSYLWVERAKDQCANRRIPRLFVETSRLKQDVLEIQKEINPKGYRLTIPIYETELYYKLSIAECMWEWRHGILKIQIPVIKSSEEWKLFRVQPIPYGYQNRTCYLDLPNSLIAINGRNEIIRYGQEDMNNCKVETDMLCQIPKYGIKTTKLDICIQKMIKGASIATLIKFCDVHCHEDQEPTFTVVAPRTYIITNAGVNRVAVTCPGQETPIQGPAVGSIRIYIPCNCNLIIDSIRVDTDYFPCIVPDLKRTDINLTLPVFFTTKYPHVTVALNQPVLLPVTGNISSVLNPSIDIYAQPVTNTTQVTQLKEELDEMIENNFWGEQFESSNTFLYCWMLAITVLLLYIMIYYRPVSPVLGTAIAMTPLIKGAEGRTTGGPVECYFPVHIEIIIFANLAWMILITLPYTMNFIRAKYEKFVTRRAVISGLMRQEGERYDAARRMFYHQHQPATSQTEEVATTSFVNHLTKEQTSYAAT